MQAGKHEKCVFFRGKIAFSVKTGHIKYAGGEGRAPAIPSAAIMKKQEPKPWKSPPGPRWD